MKQTILIIPPEFKKDVNHYSGFLTPGSEYSKKTLKGLFFTPENIVYVGNEMMAMITNTRCVMDNLPPIGVESAAMAAADAAFAQMSPEMRATRTVLIIKGFTKYQGIIRQQVPGLMRAHYDPVNRAYREDFTTSNPIIQLHLINKDFILQTSRNFILTPNQIIPDIDYVNPETGKIHKKEYEYGPESWQDGTWHPEQLFTNSQRNRENPYWVPFEVDFDARSGSRPIGPGHRFNSTVYGAADPSVVNSEGTPVSESQFPRWQYSMNNRRGISRESLSLDEGGESDRRTQWTRGPGMGALVAKSTY